MVLPYEYVVYCILLLAAWDTDGVVHECAESKCVQNGQSTKFVCIAEHETIQWYAEDNRWVATNDTVYVPDEYNATITDDPDPSRSEFSKVYTLTIKNPTEAQHNAKTVNCAAVGEDTSCHAVPFYVVSKATDIPNIVRQSMICEVDNITFTFSASTAEKIRPRLHFHFYVDGKEAPSCNIPNTTDPDCSVSSITSRSCDFRDDCPVGKMVTASIKYSHLSLGTKEGDRIECNSTVVQRLVPSTSVLSSTSTVNTTETTDSTGDDDNNKILIIIVPIIVVFFLAVFVLLCFAFVLCVRSRERRRSYGCFVVPSNSDLAAGESCCLCLCLCRPCHCCRCCRPKLEVNPEEPEHTVDGPGAKPLNPGPQGDEGKHNGDKKTNASHPYDSGIDGAEEQGYEALKPAGGDGELGQSARF